MKSIAALDFEEKPDYDYLRNLFRPKGYDEEKSSSICGKRVADENISGFRQFKMPYLRERRPCKPVNGEVQMRGLFFFTQFSGQEKIHQLL